MCPSQKYMEQWMIFVINFAVQGQVSGAGFATQFTTDGVWEGTLFITLLNKNSFIIIRNKPMICVLIYLNEQILPGVRIIIANPETKGPMGESHLGEVRVCLFLDLKLKIMTLFFTEGKTAK